MVSSSAVASTLTRPRVAVAIVSAVTAASIGYYYFFHYNYSLQSPQGSGLHRRNAVRRVRRRTQTAEDSDSDSHGDENADANPRPREEGAELRALAESTGLDGNDDDWYNDSSRGPRQRTGENIVTLLFRVSEDSARRSAYVHRGCQCNGCDMVPIRGIRYRCVNCADFDLCEACEAQGLHNKTHVFYKIKIPAPSFGPRQVQPAWYPGDPDSARLVPRQLLNRWSNETGFERVELEAYWEQWTYMANTEWRDDPDGLCLAMDRKTFERCLVPSGGYRYVSPNLIHDRMFAFYDTNNDDLISFEEFLHGISYRKRKDKLRRTFQGYDIDGDGYVNRRDFLRMFRAYYVLYKQMHRDILEGLDEHMMTTLEAQQLIQSRAPLSSLFGREGRVPAADQGRPMEGKVFHSNGEVHVSDGQIGVVNEDKPDTAPREEILNGLFARDNNQSVFLESFSSSSRRPRTNNAEARYVAALANPPENTVDLTSLMNGDYTQLDDILNTFRMGFSNFNESAEAQEDESESDSSDDEDNQNRAPVDASEPPAQRAGESSSSPGAISDEPVATVPTETQLQAQQTVSHNRAGNDRRKRVQARKLLFERWRRREFYLDEEEGAVPPNGWDNKNDVDLNGFAESSKAPQQALSRRSRSSSKVRFVEDTDDFDTRSNPSTSSRSVPERWGGMEIPDAERDAGKEILYQVTQQAFNELLDEIFKGKEDFAMQCAESKADRNKYRHLFANIEIPPKSTSPSHSPKRKKRENSATTSMPIEDQSLDQLLETSGYTVSPRSEPAEVSNDDAITTSQIPKPEEGGSFGLEVDESLQPSLQTEDELFVKDELLPQSVESRDPTMPQFRPNSADARQNQKSSQTVQGPSNADTSNEATRVHGSGAADDSLKPIARSQLIAWKRLDQAEQEAKERGGWGKLNYEEFEEIYKQHEFADSARNRLDYLGSWIDFCIP